jgi:hypothetical protein
MIFRDFIFFRPFKASRIRLMKELMVHVRQSLMIFSLGGLIILGLVKSLPQITQNKALMMMRHMAPSPTLHDMRCSIMEGTASINSTAAHQKIVEKNVGRSISAMQMPYRMFQKIKHIPIKALTAHSPVPLQKVFTHRQKDGYEIKRQKFISHTCSLTFSGETLSEKIPNLLFKSDDHTFLCIPERRRYESGIHRRRRFCRRSMRFFMTYPRFKYPRIPRFSIFVAINKKKNQKNQEKYGRKISPPLISSYSISLEKIGLVIYESVATLLGMNIGTFLDKKPLFIVLT